jgi:alkanesulfonate monooxygenase SsuD/methylene tetrahydromethanopterin reductase-like flavin-dependent oxidoreductase (luciferase family)
MPDTAPARMEISFIAPASEGGMDGATPRFSDLLAMAQLAGQIGLDAFWFPDHLIFRFPNRPEAGALEAFTYMAALAARTSRIKIGPLVACTSFRNPALLAKMADSMDEISDGRFMLGLGAGWHEPEYVAFGYPFDHLYSRFAEALQIIVPLLREGHVDFAGQYYAARDCVLRPRGPSRNGPPIWIGARQTKMLELVARYADAWNTAWHVEPEPVRQGWEAMTATCAKVGRDPASLALTAGVLVHLYGPGEPVKENERTITGTVEQVAETLRGFAEVGVRHLVVQLQPSSVVGLERFARVLDVLRHA